MPEQAPQLIEGEDYYMDGPYFVFTEAYHRRRGYCCGSGCRHCPWRDEPRPENPDPPTISGQAEERSEF